MVLTSDNCWVNLTDISPHMKNGFQNLLWQRNRSQRLNNTSKYQPYCIREEWCVMNGLSVRLLIKMQVHIFLVYTLLIWWIHSIYQVSWRKIEANIWILDISRTEQHCLFWIWSSYARRIGIQERGKVYNPRWQVSISLYSKFDSIVVCIAVKHLPKCYACKRSTFILCNTRYASSEWMDVNQIWDSVVLFIGTLLFYFGNITDNGSFFNKC